MKWMVAAEPIAALAQSVSMPDMGEVVTGLAGDIGWLGAVVICGLIYLQYLERKRANVERDKTEAMTERLIQQTMDRLEEDVRRETEMLGHIKEISHFIQGRRG